MSKKLKLVVSDIASLLGRLFALCVYNLYYLFSVSAFQVFSVHEISR